ncbi:MAG: putative SAM-dependent methyltransferase [Alphaproteobacteria bacterium]|jgi:predicted SAM-dependent methyltransferase
MPFGSGLYKIFPNLTYQCNAKLKDIIHNHPKSHTVYDLGAGGRRIAPHVQTVDMIDGENTDIVSDINKLPFDPETADLVIATGVLEHVECGDTFINEISRILKVGGHIYIEIPFMQQYHDDPIDSRRYTQAGLARYLEQKGFDVVESGFHIGPSVTIATLNAYYAGLLFEGDTIFHKIISNLAFFLVSLIGYPLKFLDMYLKHKKSAHRLAFGVFCYASKRGHKAE